MLPQHTFEMEPILETIATNQQRLNVLLAQVRKLKTHQDEYLRALLKVHPVQTPIKAYYIRGNNVFTECWIYKVKPYVTRTGACSVTFYYYLQQCKPDGEKSPRMFMNSAPPEKLVLTPPEGATINRIYETNKTLKSLKL